MMVQLLATMKIGEEANHLIMIIGTVHQCTRLTPIMQSKFFLHVYQQNLRRYKLKALIIRNFRCSVKVPLGFRPLKSQFSLYQSFQMRYYVSLSLDQNRVLVFRRLDKKKIEQRFRHSATTKSDKTFIDSYYRKGTWWSWSCTRNRYFICEIGVF